MSDSTSPPGCGSRLSAAASAASGRMSRVRFGPPTPDLASHRWWLALYLCEC